MRALNFDDVDFAWVGIDKNKCVGLFYVPFGNAIDVVKQKYTLERYNALTSFIIDSLDVVGKGEFSAPWADSDVEKGFFVFDYSNTTYRRIGTPENRINLELLNEFSDLLISLEDVDFQSEASSELTLK